jgi:hypothetical protein
VCCRFHNSARRCTREATTTWHRNAATSRTSCPPCHRRPTRITAWRPGSNTNSKRTSPRRAGALLEVRQRRAPDRVRQRAVQRGIFLLKGGDSLADLDQGVPVSAAPTVKPRRSRLDHDNLPNHAGVPSAGRPSVSEGGTGAVGVGGAWESRNGRSTGQSPRGRGRAVVAQAPLADAHDDRLAGHQTRHGVDRTEAAWVSSGRPSPHLRRARHPCRRPRHLPPAGASPTRHLRGSRQLTARAGPGSSSACAGASVPPAGQRHTQ